MSRARRRATRDPLLAACRRAGVRDERVLRAFEQVDRANFLVPEVRARAGEDRPLSIGQEQTTSQPSLIALMIEALHLEEDDRVLEIGTGSGYQTALLAELCREVVSVERHEPLARRARTRLSAWPNVEVHVGDGTLGWPDRAPYQAITVGAAGSGLPPALAEQLDDGGRIVLPVEARRGDRLEVHRRDGDAVVRDEVLMPVRFVPLIGEGLPAG